MVSRLYLTLSKREYRYIFILGHVRSGSSLLAHILANHPDIAGAGEIHIRYRVPTDLQQLVIRTCELLHSPIISEDYLVDQINHDYVSEEVLASGKLYRSVILLREPERTLKSMMNLSIWKEDQALELYVNRLAQLTRYGALLGKRALLIEYDDLLAHTDATLIALGVFLNLKSPLAPKYATHRMTGRVVGYGDPSENIKAGHVIRTPDHKFTLAEDTLVEARQAFSLCRTYLRSATTQALDHSRSEIAPP
jgi:hypothetical protein